LKHFFEGELPWLVSHQPYCNVEEEEDVVLKLCQRSQTLTIVFSHSKKHPQNLLFVKVIFLVELVHQAHVDKNENDENVHCALLCKPKSELKAPDFYAV